MTRQFKITSMCDERSEQPIVVTQLSHPDAPVTIAPGRELILTIHDANPGVVIGKQGLFDIDHQALHGGKSDSRQQEIDKLNKRVTQLEADNQRLTAANATEGGGYKLTEEDKAFLESRRGGHALEGVAMTENKTPTATDPAIVAGVAQNQGLGEKMLGEQAVNTPTVINTDGATKPSDPNADAPGMTETVQQRQEIDAELKRRDGETGTAPGNAGQSDLMPKAQAQGLPGDRANVDVGKPENEDSTRRDAGDALQGDGSGTGTADAGNTGTAAGGQQGEEWKPFGKRTVADLKTWLDDNKVERSDDDRKEDLVQRAHDHDSEALDKMKKAELLKEAKRRGVEVEDGSTKAEIIQQIEDAR